MARAGAALGVAAALAVGGVAVAVGGEQAGAAVRPTAQFRVFKGGWVHGPGALHAGYLHVHVNGPSTESLQFARSRHGAGAAALASEVNGLFGPGGAVRLGRDFALAGGAKAGHDFWLHLTPGTYYGVDVNAGHQDASKIKRFVVARPRIDAAVPKAPMLWAIGKSHWAPRPYRLPHSGVLTFHNAADQPHFIVLQRLKPGKTNADVTKVFKGKESQGAVFYSGKADEFDTGAISPGYEFTFNYSLRAGHWALLCFYPDRMTGMPHALMGMHRVLTLQ